MALTKKQENELIAEAEKQGANMSKWLNERGYELIRSSIRSKSGGTSNVEYHLKEKK